MATAASIGTVGRLWRYYQAGIVNTLFGYGIYALLLRLGLWMYAAQLIAHVLGVAFNYFSYSRHVFHDSEASKLRFVVSYGFNYLLALASLAAVSQLVRSPYAAGAIAILFVSLVNYFILKNLVFVRRRAA
ncbi:MAG TPA: GtrA family protein [Sphingomicrobium sp.]